MSTEYEDAEMLLNRLRHECAKWGGRRKWAEAHGFSPNYIFAVAKGRYMNAEGELAISEGIARALGFSRETRFKRVKRP